MEDAQVEQLDAEEGSDECLRCCKTLDLTSTPGWKCARVAKDERSMNNQQQRILKHKERVRRHARELAIAVPVMVPR